DARRRGRLSAKTADAFELRGHWVVQLSAQTCARSRRERRACYVLVQATNRRSKAGDHMAYDPHLATYLNDHLAGSVAALELLAHLESAHRDSDLEGFFRRLREDIQVDRDELVSLMRRLEMTESLPRKASAWIAEKVTEL